MFLNSFRMSQHKAIHCYLLMTLWILLIVIGIYKFTDTKEKKMESSIKPIESFNNLKVDIKIQRILKLCNFPASIEKGNEGIGLVDTKTLTLKGVLILIRHGDRGPLQHMKKLSLVNCGTDNVDLLNSYKAYLQNHSLTGKVTWSNSGSFHGFPFLPSHQNQCHLGQLTIQGIVQLIKIGEFLKFSYQKMWPNMKDLNSEDLVVYSTRYRRTFQSLLALLFGMIPHEVLPKINYQESQSMSFCFKDCGCSAAEKISKQVNMVITSQLNSHPAVSSLSEMMGKYIFSSETEHDFSVKDPFSVRDGLLTFICHKTGLPCESSQNCIRRQNLVGIFAYTDWVIYQKWKHIHWKKYCILKSYGLIRNIVQHMLKMVSDNKPNLVIYSGHDHTLEQLASAMGLRNDPYLLRYGARLVFEVYQKNNDSSDGKEIYFRMLSNGKDLTKQISFCRTGISLDKTIHLCKIEDIVRFLHDDYFTSLNVTNYKDACVNKSH